MTLSSLSPSAFVTFRERYSSPRPNADRSGSDPEGGAAAGDEPASRGADEFAASSPSSASPSFGAVVRADLSALGDVESWIEPRSPSQNSDAAEFLGSFAQLLASVRDGDASGARAAAAALQIELFGGPSAARSLAGDLQSALLAPAPPPHPPTRRGRARGYSPHETTSLVQGANAAYETLMDLDANAA